MKGSWTGNLLLALLSVALTLALLEVGLALLRPVPFSIERNMYFEPVLSFSQTTSPVSASSA